MMTKSSEGKPSILDIKTYDEVTLSLEKAKAIIRVAMYGHREATEEQVEGALISERKA